MGAGGASTAGMRHTREVDANRGENGGGVDPRGMNDTAEKD